MNTCDHCGRLLVDRRRTARYCSSSCRSRAAEARATEGTTPARFWDEYRKVSRRRRSLALGDGLKALAAGLVCWAITAVAFAPLVWAHTPECPSGSQFVSAQSWWTPGADGVGENTGHTHLEACLPEREDILAPTDILVRGTLHQNPGRVTYLSIVSKTRDQEITRESRNPGWTCPIETCEFHTSFRLDPAWFNYSGLQEVRFRMTSKAPSGNEMRPSINFQTYIWNGRSRSDVTRYPWLRLKSWYTGSGYCEVGYRSDLLEIPPDSPVANGWAPNVRQVNHGESDDLTVTGAAVKLDVDAHAGTSGPTLRQSMTGGIEGPVTVNTTPGPHRLWARTRCNDPRGSVHSAVGIVPFEVR